MGVSFRSNQKFTQKEICMSKKIIYKIGIAFGLVAVVLIFLGLTFVPRTLASSSTKASKIDTSQSALPDFVQRHLAAVPNSVHDTAPDWIARRMASVSDLLGNSNPDWVERHMPAVTKPAAASSSNYYDNSDWVARHSKQSNP